MNNFTEEPIEDFEDPTDPDYKPNDDLSDFSILGSTLEYFKTFT